MSFGYALYFTERLKNRVVRWDPDTGTAAVIAGEPPDGEELQTLKDPYGLALDAQGVLWIADKLHHRICRLVGGRLETVALRDVDGHRAYHEDSMPSYSPTLFRCPTTLLAEPSGSMLACFYDDFTIYRIFQDGRLELVLGRPANRPLVHNPPVEIVPVNEVPQMPLNGPTSLVVRGDGTMFFVERNTMVVREYRQGGDLRSVFARSRVERDYRRTTAPEQGRTDDYHPGDPCGLALDSSGLLYLCDATQQAVLKVEVGNGTFAKTKETQRPSDARTPQGPIAVSFGPDGTAWVADSAAGEIRGHSTPGSGRWQPLPQAVSSIRGEPLALGTGGMAIAIGS